MRIRLLIGFWVVYMLAGCYGVVAPQPGAAPGDTLGVNISFSPAAEIFPDHWLKAPISAHVVRLKPQEEIRSKSAVVNAIVKYPRKVIRDNLRAVYVLRSLNFYNVDFGATYYENKLYLANDGIVMGYTDLFIEQSFHHEFSSILYFNYKNDFNEAAWNLCNPTGFTYHDEETGGVAALKNNEDGTTFGSYYNSQGFIDQYAQSSMENDINELAQQLFAPDANFWQTVNEYPLLRKKVRLLIAFYHSINEEFTYDYFKNFDKR